jgi:hypothetical protein
MAISEGRGNEGSGRFKFIIKPEMMDVEMCLPLKFYRTKT